MNDVWLKILVEMEESNLRWAIHNTRTARRQYKYTLAQGWLFTAFGIAFPTFFIVFGSGSWWNLISLAIYWGAAIFFFRIAQKRWLPLIWRALRQEAQARIRLRNAMEEAA